MKCARCTVPGIAHNCLLKTAVQQKIVRDARRLPVEHFPAFLSFYSHKLFRANYFWDPERGLRRMNKSRTVTPNPDSHNTLGSGTTC